MIRKLVVLSTAGLMALLGSGSVASAVTTVATGSALQHPIGQSGIQGRIDFVDNGPVDGLVVHGTATGLNPNAPGYFTLIYNTGSVSGVGPPKAPFACIPTPSNTQTIFQMVVGFWQVNPDGTGTLDAVKSASGNTNPGVAAGFLDGLLPPGSPPFASFNSYAALGTFSTVSIRLLPSFALQACGEVHTS